MNTPPVKTALASAIRGLCLTPLTILLVAAGTLAFLSAPFPVGAQPGEGRAQLAQVPNQDEANLPEKSPEQKAAEKKLETQKNELEAKLDKERDDFLKSKEGKEARDKFEKKRAEIEKKKAEVQKEKDEFENDPDSRSCCNPGYKRGVLRYYDEMIRKFDEEIAKAKKQIADDEMKKRDKKRAEAADKIRDAIKKVEAELKRLRDMPPMPPAGLSWSGFPDDGSVSVAMLPGVSFANAGDPGSDPRIRRALLDQSGASRVPVVSIPRVPSMSTHHPQVEVVIPPVPKPPMEVLP